MNVTKHQSFQVLPDKGKNLCGRERLNCNIMQRDLILQVLQRIQLQGQNCAILAYFLKCKENLKHV